MSIKIGGAGFIGINLALTLLESNNKVIVLDNLNVDDHFSEREYQTEMIRFLKAKYGSSFLFVLHDIIRPLSSLGDILPEEKIDIVFNLASPSSPKQYLKDPLFTLKTNFIGSYNILEFARRRKVPTVIQASTSEVYGDPDEIQMLHQREAYLGNVNPLDVRAAYREGKRISETLFSTYRRNFGLDTKIARIFNTYGPYQFDGDGRALSTFIVQSLRGENITIFGTGAQIRSFCYIDDLIDGLLRLSLSEKGVSGPINLGHDSGISIYELSRIVRHEVSKFFSIEDDEENMKKNILFFPMEDNVSKRVPSTQLAWDLLGWTASTSIHSGLEKTIPFFFNRVVMEKSMEEILKNDWGDHFSDSWWIKRLKEGSRFVVFVGLNLMYVVILFFMVCLFFTGYRMLKSFRKKQKK